MSWYDGDELIVRLEDGAVRHFSVDEAISQAQEAVRRSIPEERSLADELIEERRRELDGESPWP
ncbi:MAG: AbrB/MazE/SpoVT family DNA-binding domain-containing protein [Dehalococcoidia bacterium]